MKLLPFLLLLLLVLPSSGTMAADAPKVLRIIGESETGFDPARAGDVPSLSIISHIFEPLYGYDHLARPVKLRPRAADGMPEHSADFRTWTVKVQRGILFTEHPAFKGRPRELTAADFVYSFKRIADPATKSPAWSTLDQAGIVGLAAVRRAALEQKKPFDYEAPIAGMQAIDRYTLRFELEGPRPRFAQHLTSTQMGAVAREVIEAHGEASGEHPIGTGPFKLAMWRRASKTVLERNPLYRDVRYDAQPAADDAEGQRILARLKGKRLPMVDRVEIAVVDEIQPTWLAFLNGEADAVVVPSEFVDKAVPGGRLAPHLARRQLSLHYLPLPATYYTMFNIEDPLVGGYAPEQVALRRAIGMAIDVGREISLLRHGVGQRAQSPIALNMSGYDQGYRSEMSSYDPARARALLDLFGYRDRDGDGFRERPDGSPLLLEMATQPTQDARRFDELMKRDMTAIGLRIVFTPQVWPVQYKAARAGKLMMWSTMGRASSPDGMQGFQRYDGAAAGGQNLSRFDRPEMNGLLAKLLALPDGPERDAVFHEAKRQAAAWMPYKLRTHPVQTILTQPWLIGYRPPLFRSNWYEYVDLEPRAAH